MLIPATIGAVAYVVANQTGSDDSPFSAFTFMPARADHASVAGRSSAVAKDETTTFGAVATTPDSSAESAGEYSVHFW
jgi:hypothetical protein